jgi:hypothetical protein
VRASNPPRSFPDRFKNEELTGTSFIAHRADPETVSTLQGADELRQSWFGCGLGQQESLEFFATEGALPVKDDLLQIVRKTQFFGFVNVIRNRVAFVHFPIIKLKLFCRAFSPMAVPAAAEQYAVDIEEKS